MRIQKEFNKYNSLEIKKRQKLNDNENATDDGNDQSMLVLTISEKIKERRLKFFQGSVTVL